MAGRAGSRKRKLINVNWGGAGGGRCRSRRMTKRSVMVVKLVVAKEDNSVMDNDVIVTS